MRTGEPPRVLALARGAARPSRPPRLSPSLRLSAVAARRLERLRSDADAEELSPARRRPDVREGAGQHARGQLLGDAGGAPPRLSARLSDDDDDAASARLADRAGDGAVLD